MWFLLGPALAVVTLLIIGRSGTRAELLIALSKALSVAGGLQLVRLLFTHSTWTIDYMEMFGVSLVAGLALLAVLWIVGIRAVGLRGGKAWLMLAAFGALSSSLTFVRDLNVDLDFHPPVTREVRIQNLETSMTLRGGTSYYIRLPDWTNEGRARDYDISKRQLDGFAIGQAVAFEEHRGALGFRWLGNLRVAAR